MQIRPDYSSSGWIVSLTVVLLDQSYQPPPEGVKPFGRIAIIGAGLTGISSAAHAVSHGFDVVIFESEGVRDASVGAIGRALTSCDLLVFSRSEESGLE